jgi:hypothetical protein
MQTWSEKYTQEPTASDAHDPMRRVTTGDIESDTTKRSLLNLGRIPPIILSKKRTYMTIPQGAQLLVG